MHGWMAVGDALGAGCGVFCGRWTDDTHMMIGVAESLIFSKGFDGNHMAQTFVKKTTSWSLGGAVQQVRLGFQVD